MLNSNSENRFPLSSHELHQRIIQLEAKLQEKERAEQSVLESEKRYRRLFESAHDGILILNAESGQVMDVNPFLIQMLGFTYDELCGKHIWEIGVLKDIAASKDAFRTLQENEYIRYENLPLQTNNGQAIDVEFVSNVYLVDHSKVIQCNIRDITAHKRVEAERIRLSAAIEQAGEAIVMTDVHGNIEFVNPAFERTTGYSRKEAIGLNTRILKSGKQEDQFYRQLWETISSGKTWAGQMVNKRKDGSLYTEEMTISPVRNAAGMIINYVAVKRDITGQLRLAAQYQQAQKMEAVGLLAGGVAHDFNNMLNVILGYSELALKNLAYSTQPLHAYLEEIFKAAKRSADITRQLLAYARKQTIVPVVLDLNLNVVSMLKMLRRLIGEDIDLVWQPANELSLVKMDPVQVDQIMANLCVNARDAISGVGKITIATGNAVFDEIFCAEHDGYVAGEFVQLAVSDNGSGMDKELLDQIFEPFFTTKGVGHGTGLGLSMVYGIVKQNNGFINVFSEPGRGTVIRIYLPRYHGYDAIEFKREQRVEIPHGHAETVLVVEDEPSILKMIEMMLEDLGYRLLAAATPGEAFELAEKHSNDIRLLITDIVMPELNGLQLAQQVRALCPNIITLFMSGYTADMIAQRGVLDESVNFIQKPFSINDLAIRVRDVLNDKA